MMLNPTMAKILTKGIKMAPNAPEAAGILARIAAAAGRVEEEK